MKPDVIFFGDNVPKQRVQKVRNLVSDCDILLVIGSSLGMYFDFTIFFFQFAIFIFAKYFDFTNFFSTLFFTDVYSGYRIVLQAKEENKKVALINIGPTRADKLADVKVASRAGLVLSKLLDMKSKDNNSPSNLKPFQNSSSHLPHL